MTNDTLLEIAGATIRRRWKIAAVLCLILYPCSVLVLRAKDFPYTARTTLLALPKQSQNILEVGTASMFGSGAAERMAMLAGQESLIRSSRIFEAVKQVDTDLVPSQKTDRVTGMSKVGPVIGAIQEIFFGSEYVQVRQRWKNREMGLFKSRIAVVVDQENATVAITYRHPNPKIAMKAVEMAARELEIVNSEIAKTQATKRVEFLREKMESSRGDNDRISDEITAFARKNKFTGDSQSIEPRYKGLTDATDLINKSRLEIARHEEAISEIKKASAKIQAEIDQGLIQNRDGRLKALTNELYIYEQAMSRNQAGSRSKANADLKRQIAAVRSKIATELGRGGSKMEVANLQALLGANQTNMVEQEAGLRAARKQLEFAEREARKFERQLSVLPELSADLSKLTLVQNQQRKVLEVLTQRYLEAQIEADTKMDQFYVTEIPTLIDSEKLGKLPILLSVIGLVTIAVIAGIVIVDAIRGVVLTKQQLMKFQVPQYAGSIPYASELRGHRMDAVVNEIGVGFRVSHFIRRGLFERDDGAKGKIVAVTSRTSRVGKTVTSLGIATAIHNNRRKTLLIDVDYLARDRALRNQLSDLSHLISSVADLKQTLSTTQVGKRKLTVWSIADEFKTEDEIYNFLNGEFQEILSAVKDQYECIIVDCAPSFIQAMILIYERADAIVICSAEGVSTVNDVVTAVENIGASAKDGAKIYSVLTIARLRSNASSPRSYDKEYYKTNRAA
jgi:Mrp family chromosome partitioning ATPase